MNNESAKTEGLPYGWDGKDWRRYKWTMRTIFREHDLLDIAEGKVKREGLSSEESEAKFDKKQFKVMRMIGTTIPSHRLQQIDQYETGTEMWAALCEIYEKRQNATIRESTILRLSEELKSLRCSSTEDVQSHVTRMFRLKTDLASYGYEVNNINMKAMLLDSLPDQYEFEQLRGAVKYGGNGGALTPEELRVLIEEAADRQARRRGGGGRRNNSGGPRQAGGPSRGSSQPGRSNNGRRSTGGGGHGAEGTGARSSSRGCFVCGDTSHYKANCPSRTADQADRAGGGQGLDGHRQNRSNYARGAAGDRAWSPRQEPGTVATALEETHLAAALEDAHLVSSDTPGVGDNAVAAPEILSGSSWFCFDTGSNVHIVGDRHSFVHLEDIVPENLAADVKGVAHSMVTQAEGIGTVKIVSVVQDKEIELFIDGVLYVPGATHGLFSMGLALEQGFEVDYDRNTRVYSVHKDGQHVIEARPAQAIWAFETASATQNSSKPDRQREGRAIVNYTVADGVGSLQVWHERLGHTCAQYLKVMVDRGLVNGMMLSQRQVKACDACHVGKQKQKRRRKKLNRGITAPNEVVYADLLFPGQGNGTRYKAVLVIMDGWSRFLTVHLLTNKSASTVNALIQQYVVWAERQAGRGIKKIIQREFGPTESARFPVKQILTDKGGEFVNGAIDDWYASRGIEHIKVGPKSSHLNPCERAHQSFMEMVKAQMHASGFPRSFWPYALKNAAYIKNRVYAKPVEGVPYVRMFGVKPDIHHIRKFGSLAYVHVPISPDKQKQDANAYVAFVLGYAEDTVGCQVFIPTEHTVKFVAEVRVQEDVTYRDRHQADPADSGDMEWLQFSTSEPDAADTLSVGSYCVDDSIVDESDYSMGSHNEAADAYSEINASVSHEQSDLEANTSIRIEGGEDAGDFGDKEAEDSDATSPNEERDEDQSEKASVNKLSRMSSSAENDSESLGGECGSEHESDISTNGSVVGEDEPENVSERYDGVEQHAQGPPEGLEQRDVVVLPPGLRKRTGREDTPSEVQRNQLGEDVKARRTGLREVSQRRAPARYQDYVAWSNMAVRIMGKDGKPLRAQQVQVPKNRRAMLRSKYANLFLMAELEEMAAMKSKGVLEEIDQSEMPAGGRAIKTMWVYGYKTDQHGYIIRVKARLVALGNWQRPGIDFVETFAPVARMSSFRMIIALAAKLNLKVYGGDINTAYLNASLEIPQYVKSIEGFPCAVDGHMYVVRKALYGLRQSGREWNTELNGWLLDRGFQRCATEPCLYFRYEGDTIALVLVYVDDVLCATNDTQFKSKLFTDLNLAYGLKDQGELSEYLGVEVQQNAKEIFISQRKYAKEILRKYGYDAANKCGNPMETKARLVPASDDESVDSSFDYRGALGMLMYLATCTRPDLAYALGQLSRFVSKPTTKHVGALKRVLRYLVGTTEHGIRYLRGPGDDNAAIVLQGFCDSDWASDSETRKSTSGFVFTLASGAIAWMSRRQPIIALSTAEAEYVAACEASMEATAEGNILTEVLAHHTIKPVIGIDSSAAHVMATSPTYSRRTRHIELRWHYVREQVQRGSIELVNIPVEQSSLDRYTIQAPRSSSLRAGT